MRHPLSSIPLLLYVTLAWQVTATTRAEQPPPPDTGLAPAGRSLDDRRLPERGGDIQRLPPPVDRPPESVRGDFPPLPPDPYQSEHAQLPPLNEELLLHGGAHLYRPEAGMLSGESFLQHEGAHEFPVLRLPEDWVEPRPLTCLAPFLGTGPIRSYPRHLSEYSMEPRLVGYGSYELFGFAFEQDNRRRDALGHQLLVDIDFRLSGTQRFHVQFRPLGEGNTGGSYYQLSDPQGYVDNSTGQPQRYWYETELHEWLGPVLDPLGALDTHLVVGRFPFVLQNTLLMNDEFQGVAVNQNTINLGTLSNLNIQWFYGFNDVGTYADADAQAMGVNFFADYRRAFYELTYAYAAHDRDSRRDAQYLALSRTKTYGRTNVALRAMFKWGDRSGSGSGELLVLETNRVRQFESAPLGIEYGVFYGNAFVATEGWSSLGGSNFNRLRTAFEVDPLTRIAVLPVFQKTVGATVGVQLFRHHEDESWIPELSVEFPGGTAVYGVGLRYFRKTGPRTFLEVLGVLNESDDPFHDREGVYAGHTIVF